MKLQNKSKALFIFRYLFFILFLLIFLLGKTDGIFAAGSGAAEIPYDIPWKNMDVHTDAIRPGENLAGILTAAGVPYSRIHEAIQKSKKVFDVRKMQPGRPYSLIRTPEAETKGLQNFYFVYEQNPVDYVVFDLGERVSVCQKKKPVQIIEKIAEGVIESSLAGAFAERNIPCELALALSEIYAWTLDFYHFQKGDAFRIIYEEKYAGGKAAGLGRILAARITFSGEDYYAFYFQEGDKSGKYYDENGRLLQKAFLKAPLKFVRISSGFSKKRLHPVLNRYRPHPGTDYAAPAGTPVISVGDGVVKEASYNSTAGRYLQIRHSERYATEYLHLSKYAKDINPGSRVTQGQVIGYVGSTGLATGPHLDFRFRIDGTAVNFLKQDHLTADPLKKKQMKRFLVSTASLKTDLDTDKIRQFSAKIRKDDEEKIKSF